MTAGSLFSGIGGLDLGLERAGMNVAWQCEKDAFCRAVLRKHWPNIHCYEDIKDVDDRAERVDLLCGGFPCQPISLSGRRRGVADERWLWPEFARVIRVLRPDYVLLENVPGLFSMGFGRVLGDLASLGFDAEWSVVSACSVGASHMRKRVFILGHANCVGFEMLNSGGPGSFAASRYRDDIRRRPDPPAICRKPNGVPCRVDRVRALGNAVVPQVAEVIGRMILGSIEGGPK